jgi:hypothetical protein
VAPKASRLTDEKRSNFIVDSQTELHKTRRSNQHANTNMITSSMC